jgi:hypothetical protein
MGARALAVHRGLGNCGYNAVCSSA